MSLRDWLKPAWELKQTVSGKEFQILTILHAKKSRPKLHYFDLLWICWRTSRTTSLDLLQSSLYSMLYNRRTTNRSRWSQGFTTQHCAQHTSASRTCRFTRHLAEEEATTLAIYWYWAYWSAIWLATHLSAWQLRCGLSALQSTTGRWLWRHWWRHATRRKH